MLSFALAAIIVVAKGSGTECLADGSCALPPVGHALLQHGYRRANPFSSPQHSGCSKMISQCLNKTQEEEEEHFYNANWSAWKLGFDVCCNNQYNEILCASLGATLFTFSGRQFGPGDLVKETPDPALADFCREADDLLSAHFDEEAFENHSAADLLQIPSVLQEAALKARLKANLGFRELFRRSSAEVRARVVRQHIRACQAEPGCWEEVFNVQQFFLQEASRVRHEPAPSNGGRNWRCVPRGTIISASGGEDQKCELHHGEVECVSIPLKGEWKVEDIENSDTSPFKIFSPGKASGPDAGWGQNAYDIMHERWGYASRQVTAPGCNVAVTTVSVTSYTEIDHELSHLLGKPVLVGPDAFVPVRDPDVPDLEAGEAGERWKNKRPTEVEVGDVVFFLDPSNETVRPSSVTSVRQVQEQLTGYEFVTDSKLYFADHVGIYCEGSNGQRLFPSFLMLAAFVLYF
ncbi:unnamed protein product [Symbiodinium natans]|uniref:Uncharacterized protein n=1 Tax=Symbiodinium natans TaxID=878477 RepID=A0A812T018_9DINO|nr:unnamed protein product [Symbiodinium natans]